MSHANLKDADNSPLRPYGFSCDDAGVESFVQGTALVDPVTGEQLDLATQATLLALKASIDALSAKIAACNTSAVTLDPATLAALESINAAISGTVGVSNFPAPYGLTDAELRASPVGIQLSDFESNAIRALARLTYTLTGQRVDCGGSSVTASLSASQTLATVAGIGFNTQIGQAIQQSQLAYSCGFGRNIS